MIIFELGLIFEPCLFLQQVYFRGRFIVMVGVFTRPSYVIGWPVFDVDVFSMQCYFDEGLFSKQDLFSRQADF